MPSAERADYAPPPTANPEPPPRRASPLHDTLARLEQAVGQLQDSETFRRYLDVQARFHRYSWGNVFLILAQRPDATQVAGYVTWRALGRQVRRGETGIRILVPMRRKAQQPEPDEDADEDAHEPQRPLFFGVGTVFDLTQTEGVPLPQVDVPLLAGEEGQELYVHLEALARSEGLALRRVAGAPHDHALGSYAPEAKQIVLREAAPLQMTKTLAHELAHHFSGARSTSAAEETLAEAVAYVVCAHFGLDTGARSFPYVAVWAREPKTLKAVLTRVQTVSATMIARIEAAVRPRKDAGADRVSA